MRVLLQNRVQSSEVVQKEQNPWQAKPGQMAPPIRLSIWVPSSARPAGQGLKATMGFSSCLLVSLQRLIIMEAMTTDLDCNKLGSESTWLSS